jgi:hypothetical protein
MGPPAQVQGIIFNSIRTGVDIEVPKMRMQLRLNQFRAAKRAAPSAKIFSTQIRDAMVVRRSVALGLPVILVGSEAADARTPSRTTTGSSRPSSSSTNPSPNRTEDGRTEYTEKDWDDVRTAFASSIMVDTQISSLAQNLDGPMWPVKSKDETPAKYIDLSYGEALELLALKGQTADKLDLLISIMKETLAFDSPFGDMVEQTEAASERDNPLLKNMARIGIAGELPDLAHGAQQRHGRVLQAGEPEDPRRIRRVRPGNVAERDHRRGFQEAPERLSNLDEVTLTEILPFRKGSKGLHLVEALGQATRSRTRCEGQGGLGSGSRRILPSSRRTSPTARGSGGSWASWAMFELEKKVSDLIRQLIKPGSGGRRNQRQDRLFQAIFKK